MRERKLHTLHKNDLRGEIEIHSDLLSVIPSALSRRRALKTGRERQEKMIDKKSKDTECLLCHPMEKKPIGTSEHRVLVPDRVGCFENDFPYLSGDQQVIYLWHSDEMKRTKGLHRVKLAHFGMSEFFWLTKGCIILGKAYDAPQSTYDLMRIVAGFNIGRLAGQSIPHFHIQYGWEVALEKRSIGAKELDLYFDELESVDLVLFRNDRVSIVAPWTPKGQFALEVYFHNKFEFTELDDNDLALFTILGNAIVKKYLSLGIQNLNIVFANSPAGRKVEPLIAHFVPRVNMTALYEIRGVNVVDTPPQKIAEEFRRYGGDGEDAINWTDLCRQADSFDPDATFEREMSAMIERRNSDDTKSHSTTPKESRTKPSSRRKKLRG